jgi:protease YdgD
MLSLLLLAVLAPSTLAPSTGVALELDRLRMLTAEEHVAWRGVGRVNVATLRTRSMCTGTLIAEDLVLTAAHCVVHPHTGKVYPPGGVHFVAGWRRGTKVAHSKAAAITVHPGYNRSTEVSAETVAADLALIRLANPIPQGKAPFFSVAPPPAPGTELTLISYRQDRAHALTRQQGCEILSIRGANMDLQCNVTFGASGSPVFMDAGGEPRVVAVVSAMTEKRGRRIAYTVVADTALPDVLAAQE